MKLTFLAVFFLVVNLFHFCGSNSIKKNDEVIILEKKENQKYHITALFYGENMLYGDNNEYTIPVIHYMILSDNDTGTEAGYSPTDSTTEAADFYFTDVWSPDEEYIVLPNGKRNGFAIFEAKNALNNIRENKYFDTIKVNMRSSETAFYWHEFEKWEDNSIISFKAGLDGDMDTFKYNLAKGELYCYQQNCGELDSGYNKKGKIKAVKKGDIPTTIEH